MRINILMTSLLMASAITAGCSQGTSFSKDVKPILDANCLECHDGVGEGSKRTDFLVTSYAEVMKGTRNGPVVIAGDSLSSTLYRVINHMADPKIQMPPHHKRALAKGRSESLKADDIRTIQAWIDEGANNN